MQYRVARTKRELEEAFSLVYREYARRGYIRKPQKARIWISFYNILPSSVAFIAKRGKRVLATVSLIKDTPLGLPVERLFKKQIKRMRHDGKHIGEVSQFAADSTCRTGCPALRGTCRRFVFLKLFRRVFDYARLTGLDELCIAVHPRHQDMYRLLFFELLGGPKPYRRLNNSPAAGLHLSLNAALREKAKKRKLVYRTFYAGRPGCSALRGTYRFTALSVRYFLCERTAAYRKLTDKQRRYLRRCYPRLRLPRP